MTLQVPFDAEDKTGIVYVWIGSKSDPEEALIAEEIANSLYDQVLLLLKGTIA